MKSLSEMNEDNNKSVVEHITELEADVARLEKYSDDLNIEHERILKINDKLYDQEAIDEKNRRIEKLEVAVREWSVKCLKLAEQCEEFSILLDDGAIYIERRAQLINSIIEGVLPEEKTDG